MYPEDDKGNQSTHYRFKIDRLDSMIIKRTNVQQQQLS